MARYTLDEKLETVKEYLTGTASYGDIAKRLAVNKAAVLKWVALYTRHGEDGLRKNIQLTLRSLNWMY